MGVVVGDSFELDNGVIITDYYVRLQEVDIINQAVGSNQAPYQMVGTFDYYANKKSRDEEKEKIKSEHVSIGSMDLNKVHQQLYTAFKSKLENFEDI